MPQPNGNPKSSMPASNTHDINTLLNRTSVALARSQRLVDSWLPSLPKQTSSQSQTASRAPPSTTTTTSASPPNPTDSTTTTNDSEADAALASLLAEVGRSERAGLGFVDPAVNGHGGSRINGKGESELDKLRRQMLGRRGAAAAQAREKETMRNGVGSRAQVLGVGGGRDGQRDGKGGAMGVGRGKRRAESESEESGDEGGRAAAVGSKRARKTVPKHTSTPPSKSTASITNVLKTEGNEVDGTSQAIAATKTQQKNTAESTAGDEEKNDIVKNEADADEDEDKEDTKSAISRKPTSYLDEILLQRDKKKKKKKKKNKNDAGHECVVGAAGT